MKLWLAENVRGGDVVVTHHLPSPRSTHQKYTGSPLNRFFLATMSLELEQLMFDRKPALWVHGHTHETCDYRVGVTRVVCNPRGYDGHEINPAWDAGFTVEVGE